MNGDALRKLLEEIRNGRLDIEAGVKRLQGISYIDLGCARVDTHRELRVGYPEVIFCSGKTPDQVTTIIGAMLGGESNILATRADERIFNAVREIRPDAVYHCLSRAITITRKKESVPETYIAVITAGTSDFPVAEEAIVTAELFGNRVERLIDVGVAGIHRLLDSVELIRGARVVVVIAGMEGALPSVVGGLVDKPVIAVPTSVGYGASFHGLAALLGMLNSCAGGVSVVNIDNGFGAGYLASMINKMK
jgi:pyridinium-3,5-biscarboxylic acid mononucleotide synthase